MDMKNKFFTCAVVAASVLCTSVAYAGPVSNYYVSVNSNTIKVVNGNSVVNSWQTANSGEWAVNVYGDVRTNPAGQNAGHGSQYSLAGIYSGVTYQEEVANYQDTDDSTTDGAYNYTVSYSTGDVIRTDRTFQNAHSLFNSGSSSLGITYDETNNSLWIMSFEGATIRDYSMSGNLLSSFTTNTTGTGGLALDHADQTLWFVNHAGNIEQYSKTGTYLQTGINVGYVLGGEFDFAEANANANVPEPSSIALLGLGFLGMSLLRRKSKA